MAAEDEEWEHLAWSGGLRRFRTSDGTTYRLHIKRGLTGRYRRATLSDDRGELWSASRSELLDAGAARFVLPSGEALTVIVRSGLEEDASVELSGRPCPFVPAKAMKLAAFAARVRSSGTHLMLAGAFAAAVGIVTIAVGVAAAAHGSVAKGVLVLALGAVFAYGGQAMLRDGLDRRRGEQSAIVRLISNEPETIAWVYHKVRKGSLQVMRGGEYALVIRTASGATHEIDLPVDAVEPALRLLTKRAPNAHVGYTDAARAKFERPRGG